MRAVLQTGRDVGRTHVLRRLRGLGGPIAEAVLAVRVLVLILGELGEHVACDVMVLDVHLFMRQRGAGIGRTVERRGRQLHPGLFGGVEARGLASASKPLVRLMLTCLFDGVSPSRTMLISSRGTPRA